MKYIWSTALTVLLFFAGCSSKPISGTITEKLFEPAHTDSSIMMMPDGNGGFTMWPTDDDYPDRYYLKVVDEERRVHTIRVDKPFFDEAQIGGHFSSK